MPKSRGLPRYWREIDGKFYHEPSSRDRKKGFKGARLSDDRAEALRECEARNAELDKWRAGLAELPGQTYRHGTIGWLVARYKGGKKWRRIRERTQQDYAKHLAEIERVFGKVPAIGLTPPVLAAYADKLGDGKQAHYRLTVLRLLLGYGVTLGVVEGNPMQHVERPTLSARDAFWTDEDVAAFLAHATPPMRLGLMLGLYTGQREADVLAMRWTDIKDGWLTIEQRKSRRTDRPGKIVSLPLHSALVDVLNETPRRGIVILLAPGGAPYREHNFRVTFARVRDAAGIEGLRFQDLRRSAVIRLAEAECTVPQIASITGHAIKETQRIIDTYWKATRPQAAAAIAKLEAATRKERK